MIRGVVGITVSVASINLMERTKSIPQNINFGIKVEVLKDILTENKINFKQGNSFWFKSDQEDIAELSKGSSIVIIAMQLREIKFVLSLLLKNHFVSNLYSCQKVILINSCLPAS